MIEQVLNVIDCVRQARFITAHHEGGYL